MIDKMIAFLENLKKQKKYNTNQLYYCQTGQFYVNKAFTPSGKYYEFTAEFRFGQYAIVEKLNNKESKIYLKEKYGYDWYKPSYLNEDTNYYRVITTGEIFPQTTATILTSTFTESGIYDAVVKVQPLSRLLQNGLSFNDQITLENIQFIEKELNKQARQTKYFNEMEV